jgi:hypothetical protein
MRAFTRLTPSGSFMAILPLRITLVKSLSALRRTSPGRGGEDDLQIVPLRLVPVHRHDRGDRTRPGRDRQDVDDRLAARVPPACGRRQVLSL